MTRVDFYLTQKSQKKKIFNTACRLAEKASRQGRHIFIHTDDAEQAEKMDELLWTFRQGSFVPHAIIEAGASPSAYETILIGHDHDPECKHDVLINLASSIPDFFSRFERVAEIVSGDESQRDEARQRFKFYRDRGYELNTHDIKN